MVCDNDIFWSYMYSLDFFPYTSRISDKISRLLTMRGSRGVCGGAGDPLKMHKNRGSRQYWSGFPEQSQSYQASIQCWPFK